VVRGRLKLHRAQWLLMILWEQLTIHSATLRFDENIHIAGAKYDPAAQYSFVINGSEIRAVGKARRRLHKLTKQTWKP
jgi:hypothetical protein